MDQAEYRSNPNNLYHISCGGVVYRQNNQKTEIALLYKNKRTAWNLPKGTLHHNETLERCCLREIKEETGFETIVEQYLGALTDQWFDETQGYDIDKTVHYFLCKYVPSGSEIMDEEHDRVEWLDVTKVRELLTEGPKNEHLIIDRAALHF
ncbi:MAG: NUDIX domain-containing protein [Patescibacteria group bacterium]|jgi:ADP-ribose pyrophosphatase YjhB (NUDIX family)